MKPHLTQASRDPQTPQAPQDPQVLQVHEHGGEEESGWKHWALMALCCIPMVVVLMLVIFGVWGAR
jgi:hypothetical protein